MISSRNNTVTDEVRTVGKKLIIKTLVHHLKILDLTLEVMGVIDGFQVGK